MNKNCPRTTDHELNPIHLVDLFPLFQDPYRQAFFLMQLGGRALLDPGGRDQGAQGKRIGLALLARALSHAVKIRRRTRIGRVHQVVRKLVKHNKKLVETLQAAVDRDIVPALYAVIKSAGRERHLDHRDAPPFAEPVKGLFRKRFFVPAAAQA